MAWAQHALQAAAAIPPPNTDTLLARFGLRAGDEIVGRFLVGDKGTKAAWYRGVRRGGGGWRARGRR
jgi:hypothetical protein